MKKSFLKIAALSIAAVLSMGMFTGCGGKDDSKIIMGTNAAFPPFEFTTSQGLVGEFDGIDIAIAKEIAETMGKELVIEDMEFEGLVASVQTGKVDFTIAGMTITPERQESVDFSVPYYKASQSIVVAKDNADITKAEDLKNDKQVGVILGYTGDNIVTDTLKLDEKNILRLSRGIDAVQELKNGKIDAVVIDSATARALSEKNDLKVIEDKEVFEAEEYAIAVKKGNEELLNNINEVLIKMKSSGKIDELAEKYN